MVQSLRKKLAECNANKYVKRYTLNTFGEIEKCLEWATKLMIDLYPQTTLAQIDSAYQPSNEDRIITYEYDVLGLKIKEIKVNVVFQLFKIKEENDKKITYLENQPAQDLIRTFKYNALQQPIATTYEDGSSEYKYYDARSYKIAETGIAFDNNGQTATLIPLTYYGINPHGQVATTTRFKTGTAKSDGKELPTPIAVDPDNDQTQVKLFDVRGLVLTQQDAMGYQRNYVYTPTRKVAREYWQLTNWVQDSQDKTKFTTITHLDEKHFEFDKVERPTAMKIYRDNNLFEETYSAYNTFGDTISEGSQQDPATHELRRKFDRLGNIWFTNAGQGINTITLRDLAGRETLQLQSPTKDLAKTEYNNIPDLLTLSIDEIERTETERDLVGNTIKKSLPAAEVEDPNQPQPVPLNMLVSHPSETTTTISWTLPQERNVEMQFWLWQKASIAPLKIHKPIIIENGRCTVEVTDLVVDVYDYKLMYFFVDPIKKKKEHLQYLTEGTLQLDTANTQNSKMLVTVIESQYNLRSTGDTNGVTAIKLYQNDQAIAELPVSDTKVINLANYRSGIYTIKPIMNGQEGPESFPFTILTSHLPHDGDIPFSQEIPCSVTLKFLNQDDKCYGECDWIVPAKFNLQPIKVTCKYTAIDDTEKTDEFTIAANLIRPERKDKNENVLLQNIEFSAQIKTIEELSLALQVNTNTHNENEKEWVTLYKSMLPLPDNTLLQAKLSNTKQKHVRLTSDLLKELQTLPVDDVIYTNNFPSTTTLYVTPVMGLMEQPMVAYTDTSLDLHADKKQIPCTSITKLGFSLDVSGFQPGSYPFKVNDKEGVFTVAQGGMLFTSTLGEANAKIIKQATRQIGYDAWSNKISEVDSLGHVTDYAYNYRNQLSIKIDPEVDVVHLIGDDKYELKPERPVTIYGYNARSFKVGITDANQHTQGVILDSSGHTIVTVLADGTYMNTVQFDALHRITQRADSRNNVWLNTYNRNNNLLATHSPLGKVNTYGYNELSYRNSESNPAGETRHLNFDPQNDLIARYEPLGQCTTMQYERGQLIQTTNSDGGILTWQRDYFGSVLEHTDLSNTTFYSGYNNNKQLTRQYSQGGDRKNYFKLQKITKQEWLVPFDYPYHQAYPVTVDEYVRSFLPVPAQDIRYEYALGRMVKIYDVAGDKLTNYNYDTENRLTAAQVTNLDGSIFFRKVETKVNALGSEIYTHDGESTFITAYDLVNNRRFVQAEIVLEEKKDNPLSSKTWWDYDVVDRCIVDNGILKGGKIQITSGQGIAYSYESGLRKTETKIAGNDTIIATQTFDEDSFLIRSDISTGEYTTREYDLAGWQKRFTDVVQLAGPYVHYDHQIQCNANSWVLQDFQTKDNNPQVQTIYNNFTELGLPQNQTTYYNDPDEGTIDYLNNTYLGNDSWRLYQVSGRRHNKEGNSHVSAVSVYCGPNGEQNAITGQSDESNTDQQNVFFDSTSDGLVLSRLALKGQLRRFGNVPNEVIKTRYFYSVNGLFLGSYQLYLNNLTFDKDIHLDTNLIKHGNISAGYYEISPYNPADVFRRDGNDSEQLNSYFHSRQNIPVYDINRSTGIISNSIRHYAGLQISDFLRPSAFTDPMLGKGDETVSRVIFGKGKRKLLGLRYSTYSTTAYGAENAGALSPTSIIAQYGDDYESIAKKVKGDPNLAGLIAEANGGIAPQPGRPIFIPQMILTQNRAGYARPYMELMALIQGNITPYLETPQPDNDSSWWEIVISIVVVAVAMYFGGVLAAGMIGSLEFSTEVTAMIVAVTTALADAVLQGIAVGIGLQSQFSWQQVVEAGLMAGIGAEFADEPAATQGGSAATEKTLGQQIAKRMLIAGKVSVSMQLAEMAIGYRKQFDMASVAAAIIGAGMDVNLSKNGMSDRYGLVSLTGHSLMDAAIHGQSPNIEMLTAQMTGQVLAYEAIILGTPDNNKKNQTSNSYGQSQQAANGDTTQPRNNRNGAERQNSGISRSSSSRPPVSSRYKSFPFNDFLDALKAQDVANMDLLNVILDPNNPYLANPVGNGISELNRRDYLNRLSFFNQSTDNIRELNDLANNTQAGRDVKGFLLGIGKEAYNSVAYPVNFALLHSEFLKAVSMPLGLAVDAYNAFHPTSLLQVPVFDIKPGAERIGALSFDIGPTAIGLGELALAKAPALLSRFGMFGRGAETLSGGMVGLKPGSYLLDPKTIHFTQWGASPYFSNGSRVDDLINSLRNGTVSPMNIPPIQVVSQNGKLWSIDNRRLLAFNAAGIEKAPVEIVSFDNPIVAKRFDARFNPIYGQGNYIIVAPRAERDTFGEELRQSGLINGI